jgi:hypothetical protein
VTEKPELKYTLLVLADNARMMRVFSDDIMAVRHVTYLANYGVSRDRIKVYTLTERTVAWDERGNVSLEPQST